MTGFEPGDRVRLVKCDDLWTSLEPGTTGTVTYIDGTGTVHVHWDDGHSLGMVPEAGDIIERVPAGGAHYTPGQEP